MFNDYLYVLKVILGSFIIAILIGTLLIGLVYFIERIFQWI